MPGDGFSFHPICRDLRLNFMEADHSYTDSWGRDYTSATRLIHDAFPPFDADAVASRLATEKGTEKEAILQEWQERARLGTRAHENCEHQILGNFAALHTPETEEERDRFAAAWNAVEEIKAAGFTAMEPEKLIFSPRFRISGSIDLFAEHPDGWYMLLDWKYIRKLREKAYNGETGTIPPTAHLQNCNAVHYSLQLNIYELILKQEGYIQRDAEVQKILNIYDGEKKSFRQFHVPDMAYTALELAVYNVTGDNFEIPF